MLKLLALRVGGRGSIHNPMTQASKKQRATTSKLSEPMLQPTTPKHHSITVSRKVLDSWHHGSTLDVLVFLCGVAEARAHASKSKTKPVSCLAVVVVGCGSMGMAYNGGEGCVPTPAKLLLLKALCSTLLPGA